MGICKSVILGSVNNRWNWTKSASKNLHFHLLFGEHKFLQLLPLCENSHHALGVAVIVWCQHRMHPRIHWMYFTSRVIFICDGIIHQRLVNHDLVNHDDLDYEVSDNNRVHRRVGRYLDATIQKNVPNDEVCFISDICIHQLWKRIGAHFGWRVC